MPMRGRLARELQTELERALALHKRGATDEAAAGYRRILARAPDHFDALQLLGTLDGQAGRYELALTRLERAVALKPDSAIAWNNLGNTHGSLQQHVQALRCFDRSLLIRPDQPTTLRNRGNSLRRLGRHDEALASFDRAIALKPDFHDAMVGRGEVLQGLGRSAEAAESFRAAMAGGKDLDVLRYAIAALGAGEAPPAAPAEYVKGLFDDYARSFDGHLVEVLQYRTPQELLGVLTPHLGDRRALDVADLGCGTGLCGPLLRPLARRLDGVDLSPGMLERADRTGCYDALVAAELVAHLRSLADTSLDLAFSADVLIYLGALDETLQQVARVLRPGGLMAFSVEVLEPAPDGDTPDYRLRPSRRYAHAEAYLHRAAAAAGLAWREGRRAVIRQDGGHDVQGLLVVLAR